MSSHTNKELHCDFCGRVVNGNAAKKRHEDRCAKNPNHIGPGESDTPSPKALKEMADKRATMVDFSGEITSDKYLEILASLVGGVIPITQARRVTEWANSTHALVNDLRSEA